MTELSDTLLLDHQLRDIAKEHKRKMRPVKPGGKSSSLATFAAPLAFAAQERLIPAPLNEILGQLTPGITGAEALTQAPISFAGTGGLHLFGAVTLGR